MVLSRRSLGGAFEHEGKSNKNKKVVSREKDRASIYSRKMRQDSKGSESAFAHSKRFAFRCCLLHSEKPMQWRRPCVNAAILEHAPASTAVNCIIAGQSTPSAPSSQACSGPESFQKTHGMTGC